MTTQDSDKRPNVLFVISDEHNAKVMGCAGHPDVRTPNMGRLAEPLGICVIGNVEHQYVETGTEDDLRRSAKYCLEHGGAGKPGYIYSTSNAINEYSRMDRYLLMQQIRHEKMRQLGYQGPEYPRQTLHDVSRGLDYY